MAEETNTEVVTDKEKRRAIDEYVRRERIRCGVMVLKDDYLFELSCFGFGEFFNLVERQLMNTREGRGGWAELEDPDILHGAYEYVTKGKRG